jgi:hypothetical protein
VIALISCGFSQGVERPSHALRVALALEQGQAVLDQLCRPSDVALGERHPA